MFFKNKVTQKNPRTVFSNAYNTTCCPIANDCCFEENLRNAPVTGFQLNQLPGFNLSLFN
jgi:hypothetical protein